MDGKVEILLIEDNLGDAGLIEEMLEEFADFPYELKNVKTLQEGLSLLEERPFDIIMTDLRLPDSDGINTFLDIHAKTSRIPIIILTALYNEKIGIDAVKEGAQDYLVKGQVDGRLLKRSIQYSIERKKAEEKIKSLANIVESSNDAIITKSLDGIITSWNKGAEQVYGYSAKEILGRSISIIEPVNYKGEIKQLVDEIKQGNNVKHYETSRLKKDGTTINVSVTLSPIIDQSGKLVAISCIGGDITEKKIAEKLHQEKQMAEVANLTKSDFLANMSHEFRTPLNSIIGFSDMLHEQAYGKLNEKQLRVAGNISKSGKHLLNLINNILDISKVEAGKMELNYKNFGLANKLNTIRNLLSPIADRKNIKIEIDVDSKLTNICADEDKFVQIMYNLVDNAIKFSYENSLVQIGARKKGEMLEITIKDMGIGIKAEDQNKIFKPFSQIDSFLSRKSQGTGLGLSLVKQIVNLHGGHVWFRSNPCEGSVFAFAIPINNNKGNSEYVELYQNA
jgi:PAS domain S-box-containing protein